MAERDLMEKELKALSDLPMSSKDGKTLLPFLVSFFQSFQDRNEFVLNETKEEFLKVCKEKDEQIVKLQTQVNVLNKKIEKLEDQVDENEAYERRDTLIFSGSKVPAEVQDEKCDSVVLKLLENELKYKVSPNDISVAHRLGPKKNSQQSSTRSIIAKFCRRDAKTDIVSCARRAKPTGLFINESLIPQRQTVYYALRQAKRKLPNKVSGCTTIDGSVFVWIKPPAAGARDVRVKINTIAKLEDLCEKEFSCSMADLIPDRRGQ